MAAPGELHHLGGGGAGCRRELHAADHARDLLQPLITGDGPHAAVGTVIDDLLVHPEMRVSVHGDLCEVGDAEDLVVPSDLVRGDRLEVEVVATDDARVSEPEVASVVVGNRAPRIEQLTIRIVEGEEGSLGHWVADPEATDPDEDDIEFRYEWRVDGGDVVSGSDRLSRDDWKRGARIELVAWASDGEKEGLPLASAPFEIGNSPPDIVSRPPGIDASGRFVYQVEARDRDGDRGLRYSLVDGPTAMSIDPFSGELTWKATLADAGEHFVEIEVDDRRGGATRQRFFVNVQVDAPPAARAN